MPVIVTPKPPVSTFERDDARVGASFATVVDVPLFVQQSSLPGESLSYPRTSAALTKINATNLGNTTALVSARVVDFSFLTYEATVVGGAGDGYDKLDFYGLSGGGIPVGPNYRFFDTSDPDDPVRTTLGLNILADTSAEWSPDGRYLVTTSTSTASRVLLFDFDTGVPVAMSNPLTLLMQSVGVARWSPDGTRLAIGYQNGAVEVHDWPAGGPPETLPSTPAVIVTDIAWRPSGRYLAVTHGQTSGLSIYDEDSGSWVLTALPSVNVSNNTRNVEWSPDSRYLGVSHFLGARLTIYDWVSGAPIQTAAPTPAAPSPSGFGDMLAWSPNSRYVAQAGAGSPYIRVYDMDTGSPVALPELPAAALGSGTNCIWSPSGTNLVLGYSVASDDEFTDITYLVNYSFDGTDFTVVQNASFRTNGSVRAITWNGVRDLLFAAAAQFPNFNGPSLDNVRLLDSLGANKVLNGSFEDFTGMTPTSYGYEGNVPNWTCTNGLGAARTRRVYTNSKRGIVASEGFAWLDLAGGGATNDALTAPFWTVLSQTVAGLTLGDSYVLRFDAALMAQASGSIEVRWGGAPVTVTAPSGSTATSVTPLDIRNIVRNIPVSAGQSELIPLEKAILSGGDLLQFQSVGADCDVSASYITLISTD